MIDAVNRLKTDFMVAFLARCLVATKYIYQTPGTRRFVQCRPYAAYSVAKLLGHHSLLRADAKRKEDPERDQVRETCHPVWDHEGLTGGIEEQRRVHRVPDPAINALRDELMLLTYLKSDRPVVLEIRMRPIEEPEADYEAHHAGDERAGAQRYSANENAGDTAEIRGDGYPTHAPTTMQKSLTGFCGS